MIGTLVGNSVNKRETHGPWRQQGRKPAIANVPACNPSALRYDLRQACRNLVAVLSLPEDSNVLF